MRSSHAERAGKVFSWTSPPTGGHPGEEYNCRCWADENSCLNEQLKLEEISKKLMTHEARLGNLTPKLLKLELEIEIDKDDIEFLKVVVTTTGYTKHLSKVPHPLGRFAGIASQITEAVAKIKIREIEAELQKRVAKVHVLEKNRWLLDNEVKNLRVEFNDAEQAYGQCLAGNP